MKKWYQSKEVWFNVIMVIVETLSFVIDSGYTATKVLPWLVSLQAFGNIVLRVFFTKDQIEL